MSTFGGGLKIFSNVSVSAASIVNYTVPAGKYAIVTVFVNAAAGGSTSVAVDGGIISNINPFGGVYGPIHAGPGVSISISNGSGATVAIVGVLLYST